MIGRPRPAVASMPRYRPGRGAAQAEADHGITDAVKLASNENPWAPVPAIKDAVEAAAAGLNRYADHRASELRARLARWLEVEAEQVTVGAGSVTLLQQLFLAYVDPGDEVVYPWRSFEVYPVFSRLTGAADVQVPLAGTVADLDAVAAAVTPATKFVVLANPNNPTSTAVGADRIAALLDAVPSDTLVVVDEAYREFADPDLGDLIPDLLPAHDNLLVLRTFSKAQGLAGLRMGYAVGHPDVVATLDVTSVPFSVNSIAQAAALAAIDAIDEITAQAEIIKSERSRVLEALRARGLDVPPSETNFVWLPLAEATDEVYLDLEKDGVVTRPFAGDGLRVSIGAPDENDRFLAAMSRALE